MNERSDWLDYIFPVQTHLARWKYLFRDKIPEVWFGSQFIERVLYSKITVLTKHIGKR